MKTTIATIMALGLMMLVPATYATPIQAEATSANGIIASAGNYSVVHLGANPGGAGSPDDWGWFQPDQQINLFLSNGILTLAAPQVFSMSVERTQSVRDITLLSMELDLNDDDGFAGGFLSYSIGQIFGVFEFENQNYSRIFNSSSQDGNELNVYVWGGDGENDLGIDLALSLVAVPEPGTVALMLLGLGSMMMLIGRRERFDLVTTSAR